jgi:hypothetical protein
MAFIKGKQIRTKLEQFLHKEEKCIRLSLFIIIVLGLIVRVYKIIGLDVGGAWDEGYYMITTNNVNI